MTPERWRQITEIFHAARAQPPDARAALLDAACSRDASLRAEVDSLLAAHDADPTASLADLRSPQLAAGETIGPYRIDVLLGAGGMGEVYLASDTSLHRQAAIKILAPELAADPEWLRRFEREARTLASLNHPHIAAIYGIEERDSLRALALEYVPGQTLDKVLGSASRGLALDRALPIARQIALALEAAHNRGIVHRDLKPANIAIAPTDVVKVLDFGIAKSMSAEARHQDRSLTTFTATEEGFVLGTAAYMSPEQARGMPVDKRSDIWAFGCVLFEMLAGHRPFDGGTRSDTIARVLEREPDWATLPANVPASIRTLLRRCLTKDPSERLQDIGDARIEISDALRAPQAPAQTRTPMSSSAVWTSIVAALVVMAAVTWAMARRTAAPAAPAVELGVRLPENHIPAFGVAVSPDGRQIAAGVFGSAGQIYLHSLGSGTTQPLAGTQNGYWPFWSPDGTRLAYFTTLRELRVLTVGSGTSERVCSVAAGYAGGAWNRDGLMLFAADRKLFTVPARGGTPTPLPVRDLLGEPGFPQFLPDQRHFIYFAAETVGGSAVFGSLDSPEVRRLGHADSAAVFVEPDHLLLVRGTALVDQRLDSARGEILGEPHVVATGVTAGTVASHPLISASSDVLAFSTALGGSVGQLTWFDRNGTVTGRIDQLNGTEFLNPAISPDGTRVAVNRLDLATGNWDIWIVGPEGASRFTTDPARDSDPMWSPDGKRIVFASNRTGTLGLYIKTVMGSEPERLILSVPGTAGLVPNDWSRSDYILYGQAGQSGPGPGSVWALHLGDSTPIRIIDEEFAPYAPRLSPNGQWIAYSSIESGRQEVSVQHFLTPGDKKQISFSGGVHPRWTREGHELVYWTVPGGLQAVDFSAVDTAFTFGPTRTLLPQPVLSAIDGRTHYDITRDGTRLLVRQPAGLQGSGMTVVLNWRDRVKDR